MSMLKRLLVLFSLSVGTLCAEVYELRTYTAHEGKMENLLARFRDHTTKLFEAHGMKNVGYWLTEGEEKKLVYLITHKDRAAAKANWKGFIEDPKWKKAYQASIADGKLVKKITSEFLTPTDFSKLK